MRLPAPEMLPIEHLMEPYLHIQFARHHSLYSIQIQLLLDYHLIVGTHLCSINSLEAAPL
ncbi:hypothetical protein D3C78_1903900 [compost metagenome]